MRGATGDPLAVIAAHDDGDVRVNIASPFDASISAGFRWPLHPLDDLEEIIRSIAGLLAACRVPDVRWIETVLPAQNAGGQVWFARAQDAE